MTKSGKLLIYAPVPLVQTKDGLHLEGQACNGLRLWAEHFDEVVCMNPVTTGPLPDGWIPIDQAGLDMHRIRLVPLPMAYRPDQFFRHFRACRDIIRTEIANADYRSFSIGGLAGDWGSVAAWQSHRAGLPFAIWTDRVESEVVRRTAASSDLWRRRLRARLEHRPMWWWEKFIIRRAALGLFHGKETFDTYAPYCKQPQLVHDIHINKADHITPDQVQAKSAAVSQGPLNIVYTGRASAMKGPQDWVGVLDRLNAQGVDFKATWLGDGPDLAEMKSLVDAAGLKEKVHLAGFVEDRDTVMQHLREAHIFLFCHKTPESPRCLIEALVSAAPIVGYEGSFARDLIAEHQGGRLVPLNDVDALSDAVAALDKDRAALADLIVRAARDGAPFDDESVYEHRCEIIKTYL
ncbi:glycosyltransferase [uncultured Tateyamaria sp.]|uniref:glycosyltransferase n=1 Tax=uncultured Tateyamaria sp. TaxID=455651 RepID=UPI0026189DA2|nr:glycosyltransferase [uncultured Tateyamaria sp.]